jgi:hypothetical protein
MAEFRSQIHSDFTKESMDLYRSKPRSLGGCNSRA